jgi:hypothetical protein
VDNLEQAGPWKAFRRLGVFTNVGQSWNDERTGSYGRFAAAALFTQAEKSFRTIDANVRFTGDCRTLDDVENAAAARRS